MRSTSERPSRTWYRRRSRIALVSVGAALAIGVPVAWASFGDVPPSSPFYADVNALQGAAITNGCGGGNFCPVANITREAVAAWMHRGMPRMAYSTAITDGSMDSSGGFATDTRIAQVSITVPGNGAGTQFVKIDAVVTTQGTAGTLPFAVYYYIAETDCTSGLFGRYSGDQMTNVLNSPTAPTSTAVTWIHDASPGVATFKLCGYTFSSGTTAGVQVVTLEATTAPFGSTGASTLGAAAVQNPPRAK